ncbi:hypothetical protein CC78DRAFT_110709 [Lojkania enalia]|uniref:Uncharacterized protein n=1 Tax=Lojkania enalia TaxID=147567 RepID=A0A9P4KI11_9PLEO|nr:hypothetical protein CC78DRAFT_110709 [Didymosphaeria enalia]
MSGTVLPRRTPPSKCTKLASDTLEDADGDSTMHSSPELEALDDDNEMFPDEAAGPSTPRNPSGFSLDLTSELSPPNSQGPPQVASRDEDSTSLQCSPSALNTNGKRARTSHRNAAPGENVHVDQETGYTWTKNEEQPGWEWKNNRAREEEGRALDGIADKGLQIKSRYGDPLDPSIPRRP